MQAFETKTFAVIGGDSRQVRLCELLAEEGHKVRTYGLERSTLAKDVALSESVREACQGADCVILPMPLSRERDMLNAPLAREACVIKDVFGEIQAGTLVCAGAEIGRAHV